MPVGALCCRDSSMRTRIWFLQEIGSTILNGVHAAKVMSKSRMTAAESGQRLRKRAPRPRTNFSKPLKSASIGFSSAARQQLKRNRVTG